MTEVIFLSAGVPDPKRGPEFAATADTVAIASAVEALLYVTLGRRLLVFGGQPAITPMVWTVAEEMGVDYGAWVRLYQSREFEDDFPEETARFANVEFAPKLKDRAQSLSAMREAMFGAHVFDAAVFIGGMAGIVDEYRLLLDRQPRTKMLPIYSTGGAVLNLAALGAPDNEPLRADMNYVRLFQEALDVSPMEHRFPTPADQPAEKRQRFRN